MLIIKMNKNDKNQYNVFFIVQKIIKVLMYVFILITGTLATIWIVGESFLKKNFYLIPIIFILIIFGILVFIRVFL